MAEEIEKKEFDELFKKQEKKEEDVGEAKPDSVSDLKARMNKVINASKKLNYDSLEEDSKKVIMKEKLQRASEEYSEEDYLEEDEKEETMASKYRKDNDALKSKMADLSSKLQAMIEENEEENMYLEEDENEEDDVFGEAIINEEKKDSTIEVSQVEENKVVDDMMLGDKIIKSIVEEHREKEKVEVEKEEEKIVYVSEEKEVLNLKERKPKKNLGWLKYILISLAGFLVGLALTFGLNLLLGFVCIRLPSGFIKNLLYSLYTILNGSTYVVCVLTLLIALKKKPLKALIVGVISVLVTVCVFNLGMYLLKLSFNAYINVLVYSIVSYLVTLVTVAISDLIKKDE